MHSWDLINALGWWIFLGVSINYIFLKSHFHQKMNKLELLSFLSLLIGFKEHNWVSKTNLNCMTSHGLSLAKMPIPLLTTI